MANDSTDTLAQLTAQLNDVSRRDAAFRLKTAQDYVAIERRQRELEAKVHELNAYVHQLHLERDTLRSQVQAAHSDLEAFTWMLHATERDANSLAALKKSVVWPLVGGLASVPKRPAGSPVPAGEFTYYLHTSPYRLYRDTTFSLRGWVLPKGDRTVTAVRVTIGEKSFHGRFGIEEPDVIAQRGLQAKNPRPGFEVAFEMTAGRHDFSLEAQLDNEGWFAVVQVPIWCRLS